MTSASSTQIQFASRPVGWPSEENFRTTVVEYGDPAPGQVRVRNEFISVDPYMRGRMSAAKSYTAGYALGETMTGGAVGRVIESAAEGLPVGTLVLHNLGWRDVAQADASEFRVLAETEGLPSSLRLGILGMPGLTAYTGLTAIAQLREGDTVFVSGAAGAVGSAAGQIARLLGAKRVIGSAGSAEKVAVLTERYGFDTALDYREAPIRDQLRSAATEGIDVFFDNVGGDHLEAAIDVMNDRARAALCGAISLYNSTERVPGPGNLGLLIGRRLRLQGFIVSDHGDLAPEFEEKMTGWLTTGQVAYDETIVDGIDNAVDAFLGMMRGENTGKMLVRI
ncbi:NADP-dependent oxidoreductase [Microbacterium sp. NIBRBAC000506063]|uniref:NADP-dependent oxidoreductase n=1 Tax=Microbacterium sp. NIBRBAC000506063 TaxID=2734618 RepID=UPI001BB7EB21|nr:NADP-dependent oxidoreductase [Microbacterium sp. NIBRBAC000506063]QTV80350.1 NADP-dependent oxidoreductase [Microbacterium sp. NIBRBAC000506063]